MLSLIDSRIRNYLDVNKVSIHPSYFDTKLKFVSNQSPSKTEEKKINKSMISSSKTPSSSSDSDSSDNSDSNKLPAPPISKMATFSAFSKPTSSAQTYHEIRKSMIVPMTSELIVNSSSLHAQTFRDSQDKSIIKENMSSIMTPHTPIAKGRASNIEISEMDLEFLMHNYSNSYVRK